MNKPFKKMILLTSTFFYTALTCLFQPAIPFFPGAFVYAEEEYEKDSISLEAKIKKINSEGDLVLSVTRDDLINAGFAVGDQVKVIISAYDYSEKMPYFNYDSDSESDECALITDGENAALSVAKGSFVEDEELFSPMTGKNGEKVWKDKNGEDGIGNKVKIFLHDKGEYLSQYRLRNPERSNDRDDYSSGSEYANFREINKGTIGQDILYRSSSPINNSIGRAEAVAKKVKKAGIKTVINLSDSNKEAGKYIKESGNSYYKELMDKGNVLCLKLNFDFKSKDFKKGMADAAKFMASHEGPYLIHCTEGKDRTGLMSALLEAFMGASVSEMSEDYMTTYTNFYKYDSDSEEYEYAKKNYLKEIFRAIAGAEKNSDLENMDYHAAAVNYLKEGGASDSDIDKLVSKLQGNGENSRRIITVDFGSATAGDEGVFSIDNTAAPISVYSGSALKPGRSALCINGAYVYNRRDYKLSFSDNIHAGKMTVKATFKKKSAMYKSGVKKLLLYYTIAPKTVTDSNIRVKLNKKKTNVKSVRDLERDERIKARYYTVDMKNKEITFNGDYSGKISFTL